MSMIKLRRNYLYPLLILALASFLTFPKNAHAQCYDWDTPPDLGEYIDCATPSLFSAFLLFLAGVAIVLIAILIFKTVTAQRGANSQALQELPMKWVYVLLLVVVAIGAAGTVLNILLDYFGFPVFDYWLKIIDDILAEL